MVHLKQKEKKRKKNQQKIPEKNQMVDLGGKEFKTTALNMLEDRPKIHGESQENYVCTKQKINKKKTLKK